MIDIYIILFKYWPSLTKYMIIASVGGLKLRAEDLWSRRVLFCLLVRNYGQWRFDYHVQHGIATDKSSFHRTCSSFRIDFLCSEFSSAMSSVWRKPPPKKCMQITIYRTYCVFKTWIVKPLNHPTTRQWPLRSRIFAPLAICFVSGKIEKYRRVSS